MFKTGFDTGSTSRYAHSIKYLKDFKFRQEHTVCAWTVYCGFFVIRGVCTHCVLNMLFVVCAHSVCMDYILCSFGYSWDMHTLCANHVTHAS